MKKEQGQRNDSVSTPNLNVHDRSIKASDIIIQLRGTKNVAAHVPLKSGRLILVICSGKDLRV